MKHTFMYHIDLLQIKYLPRMNFSYSFALKVASISLFHPGRNSLIIVVQMLQAME